eukprot:2422101-Prymnesium_polylepis.2
MPWAELNRRGHNRPEPFLHVGCPGVGSLVRTADAHAFVRCYAPVGELSCLIRVPYARSAWTAHRDLHRSAAVAAAVLSPCSCSRRPVSCAPCACYPTVSARARARVSASRA